MCKIRKLEYVALNAYICSDKLNVRISVNKSMVHISKCNNFTHIYISLSRVQCGAGF